MHFEGSEQCPGRFLSITGQYPSVFFPSPTGLHVEIIRFPLTNLRYIPPIRRKRWVIFLKS